MNNNKVDYTTLSENALDYFSSFAGKLLDEKAHSLEKQESLFVSLPALAVLEEIRRVIGFFSLLCPLLTKCFLPVSPFQILRERN